MTQQEAKPLMSATYINGEPIAEDDMPTDVPTIIEDDDVEEPRAHDTQLDDVEIQTAHRDWVVNGDFTVRRRDGVEEVENFTRTYTQKPLSFTAMLQFTGLIGEKIAQAMSGPDGVTLDGVLSDGDGIMAAGRSLLTSNDFAGVDSFVKGLSKLATYVPDVIEDCQCIWLRVPLQERPIVKEIWSRAPDDGGLSFSDGEEMLSLFLAQNYEEVEDFFDARLKRLIALTRKLRNRNHPSRSQSSKHSSITPDSTLSQ